jgi:hypothetical protein
MQMRWSLLHSITWHANSASVLLFMRPLSPRLSVTQLRSSTGFMRRPVKAMHYTKWCNNDQSRIMELRLPYEPFTQQVKVAILFMQWNPLLEPCVQPPP